MAKSNNLPAKMYKAGERTERTLRFIYDSDGADDTRYISIGAALSQVNRRHYRSGLYYYVNQAYVINTGGLKVQINSIPDTYMTKLAWIRGFKKWSKMNAQASNGTPGIYPKYHDFKVAMTSNTAARTLLNPVYGITSGFHEITADDNVFSQFVSGDVENSSDASTVDEFYCHMVGPHDPGSGGDDTYTSIGLIRSLQDTWAYAASTQPTLDADVDTDPLANLFDAADTHDEIRDRLDNDGDGTPYDQNSFFGAAAFDSTTEVAAFGTAVTGSEPVAYSRAGFCAPFGLLQVKTQGFAPDGSADDPGKIELVLEIAEGPYHGVYAERAI